MATLMKMPIGKLLELLRQRAVSSRYCVCNFAKNCGTSTRQLERIFQHRLQITPKEWIFAFRMAKAAELLQTGTLIKDVVYELSYATPSHFSRDFKKFHNCQPRQYQARQMSHLEYRMS